MKKSNFSKNLQKLMKRHGYTQLSMAQSIGISQGAISMYVRGKSVPGAHELQLMADLFGVSMDFLWRHNPEERAQKTDAWQQMASDARHELDCLKHSLQTLVPFIEESMLKAQQEYNSEIHSES